jgi:tetratricopeptide (TPR) repeat protein
VAKAREELVEFTSTRNDARALYLLSQAHRRFGDLAGAEDAARRLIAAQEASPWGYFALAETLGQGRQFARVADALVPAIARFRAMPGNHALELSMLLPHLGFAHQELGEYDKAIASFEEVHRLSPKDPIVTGYLVGANIAAKKYAAAAELAKKAQADHPGDLNLPRLEAQALRHDGKADQGVAVLEQELADHPNEPSAYVALAQMYSDVSRGPRAVELLQDARSKFPASTAVVFELGATFEKQQDFAGAEAAFRQVLAREPEHAAALNYLGYMLAERGERLDESVEYLKRALAIEPANGSFLDSLGWAYFKAGKLDLAEENLRRAAEQLRANSVVQEHYGQLLFRLGRFEEAISAWSRALAGDGASIDRADIDRKILDARQKLNRP